jgi:hypothetical protein
MENSHHCFLSHTLYNKSYIFENIQHSQVEYEKKVEEFKSLPLQEKSEKIKKWEQSYKYNKVYPYHLSISFDNSSGSGLFNTKNATYCFSVQESEDIKYCSNAANLKDSYDLGSIG